MSLKSLTGFDANNKNIVNLADGAAATDAVTKQQLDAAIRGLDWKPEVIAGSTANITIASPGSSIDGVTLSAGMQVIPNIGTVTRVLLKDQTAPAENGIYDWNGAAVPMTRSTDADTWLELAGATVTIQQGTVNADRVYKNTANETGTLGTTGNTWAQVGGAGGVTAGNGLTGTSTLSVLADPVALGGISVSAAGVKVDSTVVARKFSADCVVTTNPQTFTHNLGTKDVIVRVRQNSDDVHVDADVTSTSTTAVSVNFGGAPTAAQYRVTVIG